MANLLSLPDESRPGGSAPRLPYALLRCCRGKSGAEVLEFNCFAVREVGFKRGERVNIFWDAENFAVGIFRNGSQRVVSIWEQNRKHYWAKIYITALVRMYQIPFHRHPLPVSCDPDGNVWVDFSGEQAHTRYLPHNIRLQDPEISFTEKRIARLCATLSDKSKISNKTWPTLVKLFQEVALAEGSSSFSHWVDKVLCYYTQDHYPHLWEKYVSLKPKDEDG